MNAFRRHAMMALGVTTAMGVGIFIGVDFASEVHRGPPINVQTAPVTRTETAAENYGVQSQDACAADSALGTAQATYAQADPSMAEKNLELANADPRAAIAMSHTDAGVNIALYQVALSCAIASGRDAGPPSTSKPDLRCPGLGMDKVIRIHPIELLQRAVELGSIDAKLMYAQAAPEVAAQFNATGTPEEKAYARNLLLLAERFGLEAAQARHPDAIRYMSIAFEEGRFGPPNLLRAYQLAQLLHALGDAGDRRRLAELGAKLGAAERLAAQSKSEGCRGESPGSTLKNPF